MAAEPTATALGMLAPDFALPGVDDHVWSRTAVRGDAGLLVMFICNHCPYVKAVIDRIVRDARDLVPYEIGSIAIMSNDPADYPEDSFENMKVFAAQHRFTFPYVIDETQDIGRAYGAVCTPD